MSSPTGLTLSGGTKDETGGTYTASEQDASPVLVTDGGSLTLTNAAVSSTGSSSSSDSSSFYGLDSGVLATAGSSVTMTGGSVTTSGDGANGVFATGEGATVTLEGVTITASGQYAHGIMATQGGTMTATDVTIATAGASSAPIATDRGGGTITVTGGTANSSGGNSPVIYSTGAITVRNLTGTASGAEAAVIEGSNTITITDSDLVGTVKWGVMLYQSMSGDAEGVNSTFTMSGGSLTAKAGPLFHVTNADGTIVLTGVDLTVDSGVLLDASEDQWGTEGSNGGIATLDATDQVLVGDLTVDAISTAAVVLHHGATLTGTVNGAGTDGSVTITLDGGTWTVTGDSHLTVLTGAVISGSAISNITGNGHTVTYDASNGANRAFGGKTYALAGGGTLTPA